MIEVALRAEERARIAEALGREPTRVELYAFDAQWSEHCSYKSSRAQLRRLPTNGANVVVGPGEDAGVLRLGEHGGERYCVVVAHESHNHPSQVVPFEGAATGVGGIVRDVLCMGAQVVGIADALRFGDVRDPRSHQRHVAQAVVDGIGAYGNAIGVPNLAGDVYFHEGFNENCLVNVVALGIVKEKEIVHSFAPPGSDGWPIVLVGKATDGSGFGGASFSSLTLDAGSADANKAAVQVPDPFLKNVLMRATYRVFGLLRERGATFACKDLGAGGVMGCSAEICASGGYGARIDLDRVNIAQIGLPPEVIAVGETQERMLFVLSPETLDDVLSVFNEEFSLPEIAYEARAVVIGHVTRERRYVLEYRGHNVMDVDVEFLTQPVTHELRNRKRLPRAARENDAGLSSLNACSRKPLYRRYDSVVRGCTVIPRGYSDAGVLAPIPGSKLGVALAVAGDPALGVTDARLAAERAVLESMQKVVAVGATPIGLTDCLNFGNPQNAEHYADFVAAVDGLEHAARAFDLPFVSGNVSFYNETSASEAIPPSAIVACVGVIDDVEKSVANALEEPSHLLFVGSRAGPHAPIEYETERKAMAFVLGLVALGIARAAKTVGEGGVLRAALQMASASGSTYGVSIDAGNAGDGCGWIVAVPENVEHDIRRRAAAYGLEHPRDYRFVGSTSGTSPSSSDARTLEEVFP